MREHREDIGGVVGEMTRREVEFAETREVDDA